MFLYSRRQWLRRTAISSAGVILAVLPPRRLRADPAQDVLLTFGFGDGRFLSVGGLAVDPPTALDALQAAARRLTLPLRLQDFGAPYGVLVSSIGDDAHGGRGFWRYWVNRKIAPQGAAAMGLVSGDQVAWRFTLNSAAALFLRGDSNGDGTLDISDPIRSLLSQFGGQRLPCPDAADVNDDGVVDIADPIAELQFLFRNGPPLAAPFPWDGMDQTADALGCRW